MYQKISLPAWLMIAAIVVQALLGMVTGYQIHRAANPPHQWRLDSTEYYKFLEGQGRLNLRFYEHQQSHAERLRKLDRKRQADHSHIDSLSGPDLQQEIDRLYNNRGQSSSNRPQTNSANRTGGTPSTEGSGGPDHDAGRGKVAGHATSAAKYPDERAGVDDSETERNESGQSGRSRPTAGQSRGVPEEVARSSLGELDSKNRSRGVRRSEGEVHAQYWALILTQDFTYPDVAWAISAVETGYWWKEPPGHNLFGMKKSNQRPAFYVSLSETGYCRYENERASLADYADYERTVIKKYGLRNRQAYIDHIQRRFCPNPRYRSKLALAFSKLNA